MKIGFYAGSFDPFTVGHLHVVKTASLLFDKVVIGIGTNPNKTRRYDKMEMCNAIQKLLITQNLLNVEIVVFEGLTVDAANKNIANFLIRGLRTNVDFSNEENVAKINKKLSGIETVYIRAGSYGTVSSSMVYELIKFGKDVSEYLPPEIIEIIYN